MLYAMMREDRGRYAARARSYKAVAQADQLLAVYTITMTLTTPAALQRARFSTKTTF